MENIISTDASHPVKKIALTYINAFGEKQYEQIWALLDERMTFSGPIMTYHNASDYLAAVKKIGTIVTSTLVRRIFAEGSEVCIIYDMVTDSPVGIVPCVEWLNIEGGKIVAIELIFDRHRWAEAMVEIGKRLKQIS